MQLVVTVGWLHAVTQICKSCIHFSHYFHHKYAFEAHIIDPMMPSFHCHWEGTYVLQAQSIGSKDKETQQAYDSVGNILL